MDSSEFRLPRAEIRSARNGGVALAFQVVGDGDIDLVYVPDYVSNLVYGWEYPPWRDFYLRLARSFRLILFDKRGTGLSDHGGQFATLETRMEDLHAVLDAAGSSNPVIFGAHEGSGMAVFFAASYPERTRALVLFHAIAKSEEIESESVQRALAGLREGWGVQEWCDELLRWGCPSLAASEDNRRRFANWLRVCASPAVAYALNRAFYETDLRDVLPAVRVPTLLLYRALYETETMDIASRITNARAMRVSGDDYFGIFLSLDSADEIERFIAGEEAPSVPESVLATVMFTDIVGSSDHAARIGDRAWRDLLGRHHAIVRRELARYRGHERDTAGDGFFATFDGPARAISAAQAIVDGVRTLGLEGADRHPRRRVRAPRRQDRRARRQHRVARGLRGRSRRGSRLANSARPRRRIRNQLWRSRQPRAQGNPRQLATLRSRAALTKRPEGGRLTAAALQASTYGPAVVKNASVRFVVLPVLPWTKNGTKRFPVLASPS